MKNTSQFEPAGNNSSNSQSQTVAMFLSLYLVMLAFFIVLNALSSFSEPRVSAARDSLNETFAEQLANLQDQLALTEVEGLIDQQAGKEKLKAIGTLIRTDIPAVQLKTEQQGLVMYADFKASALFENDSTLFVKSRYPLLRRIAGFMKDMPQGVLVDMRMTIGAPELPGGGFPIAPTLESRRVGSLVRELIKFGVPQKGLSAGLVKGSPETVRLTFSIVPEDAEVMDFSKPPEDDGQAENNDAENADMMQGAAP